MLIAIDWDKTFTADTALWMDFANLAKTHGHAVIIVTGRNLSHPLPDTIGLPVVYSSGDLKREAAETLGYKIDIWIDDEPGTIERCRILEWEE